MGEGGGNTKSIATWFINLMFMVLFLSFNEI
jgi:hypothetical protein